MRLSRLFAISFTSATAMALFGCGNIPEPTPEPAFYRSMAQPGAKLDVEVAASMISGYRRNAGLNPVSVDPVLTQLAEQQARVMARRDKLDHNAGGPFAQRMKAGGYVYKVGAENIGAGYHTLAEAFSGWREQPQNNRVMLDAKATRLGIATAYAPQSKYKVYWALIMAGPAKP